MARLDRRLLIGLVILVLAAGCNRGWRSRQGLAPSGSRRPDNQFHVADKFATRGVVIFGSILVLFHDTEQWSIRVDVRSQNLDMRTLSD